MRDTRIESVLKSMGIKYQYEAEYPVSDLISDERTQVRFANNVAPAKEVLRYADLERAGAEFPPIVILQDGTIVDGNTRAAAFQRNKRRTIPAYALEITSPAIAKRIGIELNAQAGKRMEKAELVNWLAESGGTISEEDQRRITGWSPDTVRRIKNSLAFKTKCDKLGVTVSLPEAVQAKLYGVTNPDVFRTLTKLADDAWLSATELGRIVKDVNKTSETSVDEALAIITDLRSDLTQRIQERTAGLKVKSSKYQQITMHAGWFLKQGSLGLCDTNPQTAPKTQAVLDSLRDVIDDALNRY